MGLIHDHEAAAWRAAEVALPRLRHTCALLGESLPTPLGQACLCTSRPRAQVNRAIDSCARTASMSTAPTTPRPAAASTSAARENGRTRPTLWPTSTSTAGASTCTSVAAAFYGASLTSLASTPTLTLGLLRRLEALGGTGARGDVGPVGCRTTTPPPSVHYGGCPHRCH